MTDKALIIAINNAPAAPRLRGTHTDAHDLARRLIQAYGFDPGQIRLLFDDRATTKAIRERVEGWLLPGSRAGDRLVFAYSGHGARETLRNRQGAPGGSFETLVPFDFEWSDTSRWLPDSWIANVFGKIGGSPAEKTVILDCCHAGGMDRSFFRRITRRRRGARGVDAPDDVAWREAALDESEPLLDGSHGFTLLGACRAYQVAADCYEGKAWRGAFSWALGRALREGGTNVRLSELRKRTNQILARRGYPQDPRFVADKAAIGGAFLGGVR